LPASRARVLRPVVLAYHGVHPGPVDDPLGLVMTPDLLDRHVRLLLRLGYRIATADELARARPGSPPPRGTAVLTFDDGWRDAIDHVLPVLRRHGIAATFYVNPGLLGGTHHEISGDAGRLLDEPEARALAAAGMDLGCHANLHRDLRGVGDAELRRDLAEARAGVEALTGRPCRTFAYPYGGHDRRVEAAVSDAGFSLAFAWLPGPWRAMAAPRIPAPTRHSAARLALSLAGVRRRRTVGPPPAVALQSVPAR
jgi:peptidoglycan/xylan/chitin deacetylase (PgdA/CDA1 family)